MRNAILAALLLAPSLASTALPAAAQERDAPRGLTIAGTGEVSATPDLAVVHVGVVSPAATARAALDANNKAMEAILAAVKDQGVPARDVQTSQFNVQPRYRHDPENQRPPRLDGYEVSNQVAVTVRDLDRLGAVLDAAVSVGSNQIHSIAFAIDDPEPQRDEARRLAVEDAVRKARVYAEAAGIRLGPIRSILEPSRATPPRPVYQRMEMAADAAVPIAEGEQAIEVEVIVTWDIR